MTTYPNSGTFNFQSKDVLLLKITPYKVIDQSTYNASDKGIRTTLDDEPMVFLLPSTFQDNVIHDWGNVDALGTRAVQKFNDLKKGLYELTRGGTKVVTQKMDTPTTYIDSTRRLLDITFVLADQGSTKDDVFEPVRRLQKYSCAEKLSSNEFDLPYIVTVETIDSDLIYIQYAAITSVQPSWYGPYRSGYPSKCDLTVTFQELEPLYRNSFDSTSKGTNSKISKDRDLYNQRMVVK